MEGNRPSSLSLPCRELGPGLSLRPVQVMGALSCSEPARRGRMPSQQAVHARSFKYVSSRNKGWKVKGTCAFSPCPPPLTAQQGAVMVVDRCVLGPDTRSLGGLGEGRTGHRLGVLYSRLALQRHPWSDFSFPLSHFET